LSAAQNYFEVFALPRKLHLDTKALEQAFYAQSRACHPDRFASASPEKQAWALEQTALLNDAYRTLKHPLTRTEYLLKLEGVALADEREKSKPPADLLEEVFELNMQLEEMRLNRTMGEDDPQLRAELSSAKTNFEAQLTGIDAELEKEWTRWDAASDEQAQTAAKTAMAALLDKRRYVRNLVRDVNEALA
jgi:molecular chaperone HscB